VGSAGSYQHIAVVEIPLPWPADIVDHPDVAPASQDLRAAGVRVQAVTARGDGPDDLRRVLHFWRLSGPFRAYGHTERLIAQGEVAGALSALAAGSTGQDTAAEPDRPSPTSAVVTDGATDVLICSHGRRDACCGTLGTRLAERLTVPELPELRVWRTSHTGGHRFAPTAMVLPEGTLWAYLDGELLCGIVTRTLDVDLAAGLYRGCTGLDAPEVQACDREALRTLGWSWLDHARQGSVLQRHNGATEVRLDHRAPDGTEGTFEATVEVARWMPVPDCRKPLDQARKNAPELRVTQLRTRPRFSTQG
jgi:hypothetical protein